MHTTVKVIHLSTYLIVTQVNSCSWWRHFFPIRVLVFEMKEGAVCLHSPTVMYLYVHDICFPESTKFAFVPHNKCLDMILNPFQLHQLGDPSRSLQHNDMLTYWADHLYTCFHFPLLKCSNTLCWKWHFAFCASQTAIKNVTIGSYIVLSTEMLCHTHTYKYMYVRMCLCVCLWVHTCTYVYVCVHVLVHVHTYMCRADLSVIISTAQFMVVQWRSSIYSIISQLMDDIRGHIGCLYKLAECIAVLDMLHGFTHNCSLSSCGKCCVCV